MKKLFVALLAALMLALGAAGASAEELTNLQEIAKSVLPEGAVFMAYEIDDGQFELKYWNDAAQEIFEVKVDPTAKRVTKLDTDRWDDRGSKTVTLTKEQAEQVVLAEYPGAAIDFTLLDNDDGYYEYKVSFTLGDLFGVFCIHPETGVVLEREITFAVQQQGAAGGATSSATGSATGGALTAEQAKALVLSRVSGGTIVEFETDTDDGRKVYEGEVRDSAYEYEFEIDAATGRFLQWERERLNTQAQATSGPAAGSAASTQTSDDSLIGTSKAKSIALAKAGSGRVSSIKLSYDDGRPEYEGKVITATHEYEFEIDARTGSVLDWDAERLDDDDDDDRPATQQPSRDDDDDDDDDDRRPRRDDRDDDDDDDDDD